MGRHGVDVSEHHSWSSITASDRMGQKQRESGPRADGCRPEPLLVLAVQQLCVFLIERGHLLLLLRGGGVVGGGCFMGR